MMQSGQELLEASIVTLVFALGLRTEPQPRGDRPDRRLLVRALFARDVFVPLFAMSVLSTAGVPRQAILGATLLAISPGIPIVLQRELHHGRNAALVFRTTALEVLLSIVSVPLWLVVVSRLFVDDASIMPLAAGRLIALLFLVPFGAGMVMRRLAPRAMLRASSPIMLLADLLLLIASLVLLADVLPFIPRLGSGFGASIVGITAFVLLVGDVAAGSHPSDRRTVSLLCAARHPGLALLIAQSNFASDLALPAVMAGMILGTLLTLPFAFWRRRPRTNPGAVELAEQPMLAPRVNR
jgi:BASS family bile acid:Na+ symporter